MNLVCLDTHYFCWGILLQSRESQKDMIPAAIEFFKWLDDTDAIIVVPTPIVTELLMGADASERLKILSELEGKFRVMEFDLLSAKYAADIWNAKKASGALEELLKTGASKRTRLKIDVQIVAIAMAANASVLYTEDSDFQKLADGFIPVRKMPLQAQGSFLPSLFAASNPVQPSIPTKLPAATTTLGEAGDRIIESDDEKSDTKDQGVSKSNESPEK